MLAYRGAREIHTVNMIGMCNGTREGGGLGNGRDCLIIQEAPYCHTSKLVSIATELWLMHNRAIKSILNTIASDS